MRLLLIPALVLVFVVPAAALPPVQGTLEGEQIELHEEPDAGRWTVRRAGMPALELRPKTQEAALVIGQERMVITYEPLPFFPPAGATASEGPADPERGCVIRVFESGGEAVAHCRASDGRLLWAAVREEAAWRFVWIAAP
jgi:hypothetical protein